MSVLLASAVFGLPGSLYDHIIEEHGLTPYTRHTYPDGAYRAYETYLSIFHGHDHKSQWSWTVPVRHSHETRADPETA